MKHIDNCNRQEWIKILRGKGICTPVYVDTKGNAAAIFTKILSVSEFTRARLRNRIMYDPRLQWPYAWRWLEHKNGEFKKAIGIIVPSSFIIYLHLFSVTDFKTRLLLVHGGPCSLALRMCNVNAHRGLLYTRSAFQCPHDRARTRVGVRARVQ